MTVKVLRMFNGIRFQMVGATWLKALLAKLLKKDRKNAGDFESGCRSKKLGTCHVDLGMGVVGVEFIALCVIMAIYAEKNQWRFMRRGLLGVNLGDLVTTLARGMLYLVQVGNRG